MIYILSIFHVIVWCFLPYSYLLWSFDPFLAVLHAINIYGVSSYCFLLWKGVTIFSKMVHDSVRLMILLVTCWYLLTMLRYFFLFIFFNQVFKKNYTRLHELKVSFTKTSHVWLNTDIFKKITKLRNCWFLL